MSQCAGQSNCRQPSATEHLPLLEADLAKLRPTQITAGFAEVAKKRTDWASLSKEDRRSLLQSHWFPAVLGPRGSYHIVDHQHLGMALLQDGVERCGGRANFDHGFRVSNDQGWKAASSAALCW